MIKILTKSQYNLLIRKIKEQRQLINSLRIQNSAYENLLYGDNQKIDFPNSEKGGGPEDISGILEN